MTAAEEPRAPTAGAVGRARASLAALETLERLRESSQPATAADRDLLFGWAGWGSLANAFEPRRAGVWAEIGERIEWLLPPEHQIEGRKSTFSAFYTPPEITRACWQILQGLGFEGGRILEPGCGAGVFMEHTPAEIRDDVRWLGVERDPTTAAIASALHPDAQILTAPIQKARLPVASVDAVLGNVPFGQHLVYDPTAPEAIRASLHNYCLWRSIQTLRPGGIAVLITSRYTLDAVDPSARQALFAHGDLLGAIRLPSTVWQAGGTRVTADVLVLRRRRGEEDVRNHDRTWLDTLEVPGLNDPVNRLWLTRPDLVVGTMRAQHGHRYGQKLTVEFSATETIPTWQQGMAAAVETLTAEQPDQEFRRWHVDAPIQVLSADNALLTDADGRLEGSFHIVDGRAMVVMDGQLAALQTRRKNQPGSANANPDSTASDESDHEFDDDATGDGESTTEAVDDAYLYSDLGGKQLTELRALIELRDATVAVQAQELLALEQERIAQRADQRIAVAQRQQRHARDTQLAVLLALSSDTGARLLENPHLRAVVLGAVERAATVARDAGQDEQAVAERGNALQAVAAYDAELVGLRERLNSLYDAYRSRYGFLNRVKISTGKPDEETGLPTITKRRPPTMQDAVWATPAGAAPVAVRFRTDPNYYDLLALEDWDGDNQVGHKHTIFTSRVNKVPERITRADSAADAVALSLDAHNKLDLPTIAALLDVAVDQVPDALGDLAYFDPVAGEWTESGEYLSGNVRVKLDQAMAAAARDPRRFTRNVDALRARQPRDLGPGEIYGQLGAAWIPEDDVAQFIRELLNPSGQVVVKREALTSTWTILLANKADRSRPEASHEWGTEAKDAYSLIEIELNGGAPEVRKTITENGKKTSIVDLEATAQAKARQKQIATRFSEWLWEDPDRADRLAESYNRTFNAAVLRDYDGSHLTVPGMAADFVPYASQRDMVFRAISNKTALCGHAVGGGKTTIMAMTAVKLRQLGLANKPMIVVLKATLEDIAREIRQRVPSAKLLVADEASMSDWRSRTLWAKRCATGDYDAVIITHPAFTKISMHEQFQAEYLAELAASYRASLTAEMGSVDAEDNETGVSERRVKQVEKLIADLEARADYMLQHATDSNIHFEQLGVDYLLVDEFHYFKNLQVPCHTEGFSMSASKRASDLDMKLSWLRGRGDRVATFFSGTPVSNSMLELYVVLHYLMPERLDELGLSSPDAWARWCVQFEENLEIAPDGQTPRTKRRPTRFKNVYELLMLLTERSDIRSKKQLGLVLPPTVRSTEVVPRSRVQEAYIAELAARAEAVKGKPPRKGADNILNIATDGRKCAIDPELVEVFDPSPVKYDTAIDQIVLTYRATADLQFPADAKHEADAVTGQRGGFQLVFCDLGTPGDKSKDADKPAALRNPGQVYAKIRDGLIAEGVPRERIRFIHDAKSDQQRVKLFTDCRNGKVSVLIASTEKGGVGVNVQDRLVRIHHVDAPWRPSDIEQREGRGERPGNRVRALADLIADMEARDEHVPENWPRAVQITAYVTEGSFDAFMWGKLEYKAEFIGQLLGGKLDPSLREIEDVGTVTMNYAEVKALSTGNELLMELAKAEQQFKALNDLAAAHTRTQRRLESDIARNEKTVASNDVTARALTAIAETAESCVDDQRGFFTSSGNPIPANDLDEVLANLAQQAVAARNEAKARRSAADLQRGVEPIGKADDVVRWHEMGLTFEFRANGWRNEILSALVRPHGLYSSKDLHRVELKLNYVNKGQHFRIRQALDQLLATCTDEINGLQTATLELRDRIDAARRQIGKPFPQLAELQAARAEKDRINTELAAVKAEVDAGPGAPNTANVQKSNTQILQLARVAYLNPASRRGLVDLLTAINPDTVVQVPSRPRLLTASGQPAATSVSPMPAAGVIAAAEHTDSISSAITQPRTPGATITLPDKTALSETRAPDSDSRTWTGIHPTGAHILIIRHSPKPTGNESSRVWAYRLSRRSSDGLHLIGEPWEPDERWDSHTELIEHLQLHLAAYTTARALLPVAITQARQELAALRAIPNQRRISTDSPLLTLPTGETIATTADQAASYLARAVRTEKPDPLRWRGVDIRIDTIPARSAPPGAITGPVCIINAGYRLPLSEHGPSGANQSSIQLLDQVVTQAEHLVRDHDAYLATLTALLDDPTRPLDALPNRPSLATAQAPEPTGLGTPPRTNAGVTATSPGASTRSTSAPTDSGQAASPDGASRMDVAGNDAGNPAQAQASHPAEDLNGDAPAHPGLDHPNGTPHNGSPTSNQEQDPEPPQRPRGGPGPWSRRIKIDIAGTTATVSGTRQNDPRLLRNALKYNGFQWKPKEGAVWKFTQRRRGPTRDEAVQAIRDVLTELDKETAARSAPLTFPPTPQQQAIIDACLEGRAVAVSALAGTGKTSTLRMIADRMPGKKIIYLAFNRAIADEAQAAFGPKVMADTIHAIAKQALLAGPYRHKLDNVADGDGFPDAVAAAFEMDPDGEISYGTRREETIGVLDLIRMSQRMVKRFRESGDAEIDIRHLATDPRQIHPGLADSAVACARRIWADKARPDGVLRFTHDDYLKIWALGNPRLPGDVIFFDEVQDSNELQAKLVQAQPGQVIVVGDSYQSIYGFRGAKDYLRTWPAEVNLPLTQSWRFGPEVAAIGNRFLRLLNSQLELEGNPGLNSTIGEVADPDAVLCRTNAAAVAAVIAGIDAGKRVALVGGARAITDIAKAAQDLQRGRRTKHPDLSTFTSWQNVRDYVNNHDDAQSLRMFVRLVDIHGPDGLFAMANDLVGEDETDPEFAAELVVSTAHKAKGREWNAVRIADDFKGPTEDPDTGETILPTAEELRLAYVTVTRAKQRLDLGSLDWILNYSTKPTPDMAQPVTTQAVSELVEPQTPGAQGLSAQDTPSELTEPEPAQALAAAYPEQNKAALPTTSTATSADQDDEPITRSDAVEHYGGDAVLETLTATDDAGQWRELIDEIGNAGYQHLRQDGVGHGDVDHDGRTVRTDSGWLFADELVAVAEHVASLRERLNEPAAHAIAHTVLELAPTHSSDPLAGLRAVVAVGVRRTTARFVANRLHEAAVLRSIASAAAEQPNATILSPSGALLTYDADFMPGSNDRPPVVRGSVRITLMADPAGLHAAIEPTRHSVGAHWERLPSSPSTDHTTTRDYLINIIDSADHAADERYDQAVREIARALPAAPHPPTTSEPPAGDPQETDKREANEPKITPDPLIAQQEPQSHAVEPADSTTNSDDDHARQDPTTQGNLDSDADAPASATDTANLATDGPSIPLIEHNHSGTVVRRTSKEDHELRNLLTDNKFKWSDRQSFWYLGRQQRVGTRSYRVRNLIEALDRAGRAYELRTDETAATADTAPVELPTAEQFTAHEEIVAAARATWSAYLDSSRTPAGRQIITEWRATRPDGRDLAQAADEILRHHLDGAPQAIAERYVRLFQTASALHTNLTAERKRAPQLMTNLTALVEFSRDIAARLIATIEAGNTQVFVDEPTSDPVADNPASTAGDVAPEPQMDLFTTDSSPTTKHTQESPRNAGTAPTAETATARTHAETTQPQPALAGDESNADDDEIARSLEGAGEPDLDTLYADEGWTFIDGLTGISDLLRAHHWDLVEEVPVEVGGIYTEHWRRHDVSIGVSITPDDRVMSTVFRRLGPWESPRWEEVEVTTASALRAMIEQAGLQGIARPARLPGLWRVQATYLASDAQDAVRAEPEWRLANRSADIPDEDAWWFAPGDLWVPLAPPLPTVSAATRAQVITYVLGDQAADRTIRTLVSIVLNGRSRSGITPHEALARLAGHDTDIFRRAVTAAAGRRDRGAFDVARARDALERLAEGDPTLPMNCLGEYIELADPWLESTSPSAAAADAVRGVVVDIEAQPDRIVVIIDRDAPSATGARQARQEFALDAVIPRLDPASRPANPIVATTGEPATPADVQRSEDVARAEHRNARPDVPDVASVPQMTTRDRPDIAGPAEYADPETYGADDEDLNQLTEQGALSSRVEGALVQTLRHTLPVGWSTTLVADRGIVLRLGRDDGPDPSAALQRHRRYVAAAADTQQRHAELVDRATALHANLLVTDRPGFRPPEQGQWFTPLHNRAQLLLETADAGLVNRLVEVKGEPWVAFDEACNQAINTALAVLTARGPVSAADLTTRILTVDEQPRNTAARLEELADLIELSWIASPDAEHDQVAVCQQASAHLRAVGDQLVAATADRTSLVTARIAALLSSEFDATVLERAEHALADGDRLAARERLAWSVSITDPLRLVDPIARQALRTLLFSVDDRLDDLRADARAENRADSAAESVAALANQLQIAAKTNTRLGRALRDVEIIEIADRLTTLAEQLAADGQAEASSARPNPGSVSPDRQASATVPGGPVEGAPRVSVSPPPIAAEAGDVTANAEGDTSTADVTTEDAERRRTALTDQDIASVLRHLLQSTLSEFVAWMRDPANHRPPPNDQGFSGSRRSDDPDPGAHESVTVRSGRVEIEVHTSTETRTGRPTWTTLAAWLRAGLDPADLCVLRAVNAAHLAFRIHGHGFIAIGESRLADAALRELSDLRRTVTDRIIGRALAAQVAGTAPRRWRGSESDPLLRVAEPSELAGAHRAAWDRIAALRAVLPNQTTEYRPLTALSVGDILLSPGYAGTPLRLTAITPNDDSIALTVEFFGPRWAPGEEIHVLPVPVINREGNPSDIEVVRAPQSLADLVVEGQPHQRLLTSDVSQTDDRVSGQSGFGGRVIQLRQRLLAPGPVSRGWESVDAILEHLATMPCPHPSHARAETETWANGRSRLLAAIHTGKSEMSPGGTLLAYRARDDRTKRLSWIVVHAATGHPILTDRGAADAPLRPQPGRRGGRPAFVDLPDTLIPAYLDALERLVDPRGHQIDWTLAFPDLQQALRRWQDHEPNGALPEPTGAGCAGGITGLHTGATFHAAAGDTLAAAARGAFADAVFEISADPREQWGSRNAGWVVEQFAALGRAFGRTDEPRHHDPAQERHAARADRSTVAAIRLARARTFGGQPHQALRDLDDRATAIQRDDANRPARFSSNTLRALIPAIAELSSPEPTELDRLLTARVGDRVVTARSSGTNAVGDTWVITRAAESSRPGQHTLRVDLLDAVGPLHGTLDIDLTEGAFPVRIHYDYEQSENPGGADRHDDHLSRVAAGEWALVGADDPAPRTAETVMELSQRALQAFLAADPHTTSVLASPRPFPALGTDHGQTDNTEAPADLRDAADPVALPGTDRPDTPLTTPAAAALPALPTDAPPASAESPRNADTDPAGSTRIAPPTEITTGEDAARHLQIRHTGPDVGWDHLLTTAEPGFYLQVAAGSMAQVRDACRRLWPVAHTHGFGLAAVLDSDTLDDAHGAGIVVQLPRSAPDRAIATVVDALRGYVTAAGPIPGAIPIARAVARSKHSPAEPALPPPSPAESTPTSVDDHHDHAAVDAPATTDQVARGETARALPGWMLDQIDPEAVQAADRALRERQDPDAALGMLWRGLPISQSMLDRPALRIAREIVDSITEARDLDADQRARQEIAAGHGVPTATALIALAAELDQRRQADDPLGQLLRLAPLDRLVAHVLAVADHMALHGEFTLPGRPEMRHQMALDLFDAATADAPPDAQRVHRSSAAPPGPPSSAPGAPSEAAGGGHRRHRSEPDADDQTTNGVAENSSGTANALPQVTSPSAEFGVTSDHPAVVLLRESLARLSAELDPDRAVANRDRMAAAVLDLFVSTPQGSGVRTVLAGIAARHGHGAALLPRAVELRPAVEWLHWVRALRQCATVLTVAGDLDVFAGRINEVANVIEGRIAELADRTAAAIVDVGVAAIRLVPAAHPGAPGLDRQLRRAMRSHRVTGEIRGINAVLGLAREILDETSPGPEDLAEREFVRTAPLKPTTVAELRTLADLAEAAGYVGALTGRDGSAPTLWRRLAGAVAAHLNGVPSWQPTVAHDVPDTVPLTPRELYAGEKASPVEKLMAALANGGENAENTSDSEDAARAIEKSPMRALVGLRAADPDRVVSAREALSAGDRQTALFHLSWAMPDNPTGIVRGTAEAWELLELVLRHESPASADLRALSQYPITYADDSPPHIAAHLLGLATALRASAEVDDDLGRLLAALPIHPYAANLDTIADHLAERHRFALPPVPIVGTGTETTISATALELLRAVRDGHVARRYHLGTKSWDIRSTTTRSDGRGGALGRKVTTSVERLERTGLVVCDPTASEDPFVEPYQLTERGQLTLLLTVATRSPAAADPAAISEPDADAATTERLSADSPQPASNSGAETDAAIAPLPDAIAARSDASDQPADRHPAASQRDPGTLDGEATEASPSGPTPRAATQDPAPAPKLDPLPASPPGAPAVDSEPLEPTTVANIGERHGATASPGPTGGLAPTVLAMRGRLAAHGVPWPVALTQFLVGVDPFDAADHLRTVSRETDNEPHMQALTAMAWRAQHGQATHDQVDQFTDRILAGDPTQIAHGVGRQIRHPRSGQVLTISAMRADIEGRLLVRCGEPNEAATVTIAVDPDAWLNPTAPEVLPAVRAYPLLAKWDQLTNLVRDHGYTLVEHAGTNTVEPATRRIIVGATTLAERVTRLAELLKTLEASAQPDPVAAPAPPAPDGVADPAPASPTISPIPGLDATQNPIVNTPESQRALHERINQAAMRWFYTRLAAAPAAQQYLRDRLGGQEAVDRIRGTQANPNGFLIGYAPSEWTGLVDQLRAQGFRDQDLVDAGVATVSRRDTLVDRFRDRIMFGIRDADGRLAGFTGRALSDTDNAKYLNTPSTPLFDKGSLLFGLHEQRTLAATADPVFVEGPFDVAAIAAANDTDRPLLPVGVCGTALTDRHLAAVDALIPNDRRRVFAFDADGGGRPAMLARATEAVPVYPRLDITNLPDGMDPASWAHTTSGDPNAAYHQPPYTRPALDVLVDARLDAWANQLDSAEGRIGAAREVAALLATVDDDRRNRHALDVAARLGLDLEQMASLQATALHERHQQLDPSPESRRAGVPARVDPARAAGRPFPTTPTATEESRHSTTARPSLTTASVHRRGTGADRAEAAPADRDAVTASPPAQPPVDDSIREWVRLKREASAAGYKVCTDYDHPSFVDEQGGVIQINGHRDTATRVTELRELLGAIASTGATPDQRTDPSQPDLAQTPADAPPAGQRVASVAAKETPIPEWMDPPLFRSLMTELKWDDQPELLHGVNSVPVAWIPAPRQPLPTCLTPIYDQLAHEFWGKHDHGGDDRTQQLTAPTPDQPPDRTRTARNRAAGPNPLQRPEGIPATTTLQAAGRAGAAAVSSHFVHTGIAAARGRPR